MSWASQNKERPVAAKYLMQNSLRLNGRLKKVSAIMSLLFLLLTLLVSVHSHPSQITGSSDTASWSQSAQYSGDAKCTLCDWLILPSLLPLRPPDITLLQTLISVISSSESTAPSRRHDSFYCTRGPPFLPSFG